MTYISTEPRISGRWEEVCYPIESVWLNDLLPNHDIIATDRQQLIVGQMPGGRKTLFGIQSADYTIVPNAAIREVIDELVDEYQLVVKHTNTGEFNICIVLPATVQIGGESIHRSLTLTNSYNGKTPFSIQGQSLTALLDPATRLGSSLYRNLCQNGLMGWADPFTDLAEYESWLGQWAGGGKKKQPPKITIGPKRKRQMSSEIRNIHHGALTIEIFQEHLRDLVAEHLAADYTLTTQVYEHFQQMVPARADEFLLKELPVPVQLAKQARERLRLEERLLGSEPSYWLLYNAVNYALFTARSSLTFNDRYRLDERVFHQLAAHSFD
ncbi:hypothetical protein [Persicitalea jodogahamensis]|uniref:DUF932 domain-containing protein n=1 Tax=Persicitalea jodogahamensis TaxID=402147 RepID=A0A8J3GCV0_9BACT|nr:hypothetical protein [Persicitalea jodogahamensis]GHB86883.1 hypothetical protein GCM10007390_48310 [Persicitalea jodogahamensis]